MPDMYSDQEQDILIGSTMGDIEMGLPSDALHLVISRIPDSNGGYFTKFWVNRKTRRLYAIGLLSDAIFMLQSTNSESIWCDDTPGCESDQELKDDNDDENENSAGVPVI